jgi:hypothetical protein
MGIVKRGVGGVVLTESHGFMGSSAVVFDVLSGVGGFGLKRRGFAT